MCTVYILIVLTLGLDLESGVVDVKRSKIDMCT